MCSKMAFVSYVTQGKHWREVAEHLLGGFASTEGPHAGNFLYIYMYIDIMYRILKYEKSNG